MLLFSSKQFFFIFKHLLNTIGMRRMIAWNRCLESGLACQVNLIFWYWPDVVVLCGIAIL